MVSLSAFVMLMWTLDSVTSPSTPSWEQNSTDAVLVRDYTIYSKLARTVYVAEAHKRARTFGYICQLVLEAVPLYLGCAQGLILPRSHNAGVIVSGAS
ncbi:hypothetical protein SISNIDRAFT_289802 [Sistotremastrum niveocremeum HHB9708]|uniref:Secreted protein n=1 Tax=Sistotremastrum niveocremeum HHB9708 TaxID=1314777 RepID=A0A164YI14_9AGAM|nr:hypothetical protein SISNIDRAFT_289802 [Sistotremastrum niveocremeum HHB9708]